MIKLGDKICDRAMEELENLISKEENIKRFKSCLNNGICPNCGELRKERINIKIINEMVHYNMRSVDYRIRFECLECNFIYEGYIL